MSQEIELKLYEAKFYDELKIFSLPKEQEKFTAMPIEMLEVTHERHPVIILNESVPVGFFVLHSSERVKEFTDNPNAMLLTAFSINYALQGKGYAIKGLGRLNKFVKQLFPNCDEIVLAVNHKNLSAQNLYKKVG